MDSSIAASLPKKTRKIKNLKDMDKRLVVLLKKEQIRLIVPRKFMTADGNDEVPQEEKLEKPVTASKHVYDDGVYKFEQIVTSKEKLETGAMCQSTGGNKVRFQTCATDGEGCTPDPLSLHKSDSVILGVFGRAKSISNHAASLVRASSFQDLRSDEIAPSVFMRPKEYRCIVRYTTTEFSWVGPVECGELLAIVRHLREMNSSLNKLYRHWQGRLEYLVLIQHQYIYTQREYFEWCILRILIELIEGISFQISSFHVLYSQFLKLYKQKSYRRSATFSQITNRLEDSNDSKTLSHFVLNTYSLKSVVDEYLDDIKNDFERLQNLINCRRLLKDFETSVRIARNIANSNPPWKCTNSEAEKTLRSSCNDSLAIRAGRILPWIKMLKKALLLHTLEEDRNRDLMKLRKKATKLEIKIQKQGKPRVKTQKELLKIEHKHNLKATEIEYKYWKRKSHLERRFEWKYFIRNYRGPKYQTSWVVSRNKIDNVNKMFFEGRKLSLRLRLGWEIKVLKEEVPYPLHNDSDNPPLNEMEPDMICKEVSIEDLWNANITAPAFVISKNASSETEAGTEVTVLDTRPLLSTFSETKPNFGSENSEPTPEPMVETPDADSKPEQEVNVNAKLLEAITTIQEAGREITTSFQKISEQQAIIAQQIESINLYSQNLNLSQSREASRVRVVEFEVPSIHALVNASEILDHLQHTGPASSSLNMASIDSSLDSTYATSVDEVIAQHLTADSDELAALAVLDAVINASSTSEVTCVTCTECCEEVTEDPHPPKIHAANQEVMHDENRTDWVAEPSAQDSLEEQLEEEEATESLGLTDDEVEAMESGKFRAVWD